MLLYYSLSIIKNKDQNINCNLLDMCNMVFYVIFQQYLQHIQKIQATEQLQIHFGDQDKVRGCKHLMLHMKLTEV